jgi:hypothetical protein
MQAKQASTSASSHASHPYSPLLGVLGTYLLVLALYYYIQAYIYVSMKTYEEGAF